jgi:hypothetical protein
MQRFRGIPCHKLKMKFMRVRILLLFFVCTLVVSCKKDRPTFLSDGIYTGTFQRYSRIEPIQIKIQGNNFTGLSASSDHYPVLGYGTFKLDRNTIEFANKAGFTADFDWTLILDGQYKIITRGPEIKFQRIYPNDEADMYTLRRED